jgi:hypothetical protein
MKITDRRWKRALATNPSSEILSALELPRVAAVHMHRFVGPGHTFLRGDLDAAGGHDSTGSMLRRWYLQKGISASATQRGRRKTLRSLYLDGGHWQRLF